MIIKMLLIARCHRNDDLVKAAGTGRYTLNRGTKKENFPIEWYCDRLVKI